MSPETVTLTLNYTPPLDWRFFLDYLGGWLMPGVETIESERYSRNVEVAGDAGTITVCPHPVRPALEVNIRGDVRRHAAEVTRRVRRMFDLDADPAAVKSALAADPWLGKQASARPGVRVPGAWSLFELLVRTVVGQQVSVRAVTTVMGRIAARLGKPTAGVTGVLFPSPGRLAEHELTGIGMPGQRAKAIQTVSRAVADGALSFPLEGGSTTDVRKALLALPGVGPWTVEYFALRGLRDPDAWPATDLVLRRIVDKHPQSGRPASDLWRPYRAYAAMHLWHGAATAPSDLATRQEKNVWRPLTIQNRLAALNRPPAIG